MITTASWPALCFLIEPHPKVLNGKSIPNACSDSCHYTEKPLAHDVHSARNKVNDLHSVEVSDSATLHRISPNPETDIKPWSKTPSIAQKRYIEAATASTAVLQFENDKAKRLKQRVSTTPLCLYSCSYLQCVVTQIFSGRQSSPSILRARSSPPRICHGAPTTEPTSPLLQLAILRVLAPLRAASATRLPRVHNSKARRNPLSATSQATISWMKLSSNISSVSQPQKIRKHFISR